MSAFMMNRKFCVSVNGILSEERNLCQGVPEGSILGPILFDIYVSDIPTVSYTRLDMFADDTTVRGDSLFPSVAFARVQTHLDVLHDYFSRWKIKVNPGKTEFMVFTRRRVDISTLSLHYGASEIRKVEEMKLLGVIVDKRMTFASHVTRAISKANDVTRRLKPLLKRGSGLSQTNRIWIYKIFMRSVLTYGIAIWHAANRNNLRRIQIAQNKTMRYVLDLRPHPITYRQVPNRSVHDLAGIEYVGEFARRLTLLFYERMIDHPNALIESLTHVQANRLERNHPFFCIRDWLFESNDLGNRLY